MKRVIYEIQILTGFEAGEYDVDVDWHDELYTDEEIEKGEHLGKGKIVEIKEEK